MLSQLITNITMKNLPSVRFKVEMHKCSSQLCDKFSTLPPGNVCLTFVFKETSSVASTASVKECLVLLLALDPEHLKLSLDECIEFTIFGLTTIMMQGVLSFHHLENFGHRLRQHREQQQ
jgi:hypothetical protein